jgi:hypothetical protein
MSDARLRERQRRPRAHQCLARALVVLGPEPADVDDRIFSGRRQARRNGGHDLRGLSCRLAEAGLRPELRGGFFDHGPPREPGFHTLAENHQGEQRSAECPESFHGRDQFSREGRDRCRVSTPTAPAPCGAPGRMHEDAGRKESRASRGTRPSPRRRRWSRGSGRLGNHFGGSR